MLFGASRFYHSSQRQTASSYLRTNHHRQCRIFGASTTLIGPPKFTHFCHHIAICLMPCILEHKSIRIHRVRTLSPYTRVPMCRAERKDTPLWMKRKLRSHGRQSSVRHTYGILPKKSVTLNNCYGFNRYFQKFPKCVSLHFTLVVK